MNYLEKLADDIRHQVSPDALPGGESTSLFLLYAVLLLAKGETVTREDVHNAWVAWMTTKREPHESMVRFNELSNETKDEDSPYVEAIRKVARARERE